MRKVKLFLLMITLVFFVNFNIFAENKIEEERIIKQDIIWKNWTTSRKNWKRYRQRFHTNSRRSKRVWIDRRSYIYF